MRKRMDWQEFACDYFNFRFYDLLLEEVSAEELEKCEEAYDEYMLEFWEEDKYEENMY